MLTTHTEIPTGREGNMRQKLSTTLLINYLVLRKKLTDVMTIGLK